MPKTDSQLVAWLRDDLKVPVAASLEREAASGKLVGDILARVAEVRPWKAAGGRDVVATGVPSILVCTLPQGLHLPQADVREVVGRLRADDTTVAKLHNWSLLQPLLARAGIAVSEDAIRNLATEAATVAPALIAQLKRLHDEGTGVFGPGGLAEAGLCAQGGGGGGGLRSFRPCISGPSPSRLRSWPRD